MSPAPARTLGGALLLRFVVAAAGGALLYAASPPRAWWLLAPIAFGFFAWTVVGRRAVAGFGCGVVFGVAQLLPLLGWLQDFLGAQFGVWPWLGVCGVEALFFGVAGSGAALVGRLRGGPVWAAAVFVGAEWLRSLVPFGGFPWGRLAFTQTEGPLLFLASLGGAGVVTFAVALIGTCLAALAHRWRSGWRSWPGPVVAIVATLAVGAGAAASAGSADTGTLNAAVVQGNAPNVGLDLLYQDDVLRAGHLRELDSLVDEVRHGRAPRPDVVLLPEQVGSWSVARRDPVLESDAAALGAPIVAGGFLRNADGTTANGVVRWDGNRGATGEYHKQHLVPFAEQIPMRDVARWVSPFVDRFSSDMVPGSSPGVFDAGPARLGVALCFDVAYDDVLSGAVRDGATVLAVPTNNAWYGYSEMSSQHVAMSRLRAVELDRSVLVPATSGISAVIRPDGSVAQHTEQFTARTLHAEVPLRTSTTWAARLGEFPTWALVAIGAGAVGLALVRRRGERMRSGAAVD